MPFFNNYYITHLSKQNQVITQNLQKSSVDQKNHSEKLPFFEMDKIFLYAKKKNIQKYTKWRFLDHPIYKYFFIISEDKKLILIFRVVNVENRQFIKVVDFIGSFMNQKKFINSLATFLKQNNFDYLEFLHFGFEDKYIIKSDLYYMSLDFPKSGHASYGLLSIILNFKEHYEINIDYQLIIILNIL